MVSASNKNARPLEDLSALVRQAAQGDSIAFGKIYELYFEKIYRFIFYRINHQETAEDLVAETFMRAWDRLPDIKEASSFQAWVYQIARNLVIDHYRSRKITVDIYNLENVLEYEDNFLDTANLSIEQKKLLELLKELSPDAQLVIKLKFFDDLDNTEIAKILNKSEGAIRVIQHRAIALLKNLNQHDQR